MLALSRSRVDADRRGKEVPRLKVKEVSTVKVKKRYGKLRQLKVQCSKVESSRVDFIEEKFIWKYFCTPERM